MFNPDPRQKIPSPPKVKTPLAGGVHLFFDDFFLLTFFFALGAARGLAFALGAARGLAFAAGADLPPFPAGAADGFARRGVAALVLLVACEMRPSK